MFSFFCLCQVTARFHDTDFEEAFKHFGMDKFAKEGSLPKVCIHTEEEREEREERESERARERASERARGPA